MTLAARTAALLRDRPRSLLMADDRPDYVGHDDDGRPLFLERRHADCARLALCEEMWVEEHGSAAGQARCPLGCRSYASRTT